MLADAASDILLINARGAQAELYAGVAKSVIEAAEAVRQGVPRPDAATGVFANGLLTGTATDPRQGKKRCNARRNSFSAHIQLLLVSGQHLDGAHKNNEFVLLRQENI
jgi:hypothetical protein